MVTPIRPMFLSSFTGAEMRVAETRAVNRALRKAYGIGICSVEEIGSFAEPPQSSRESKKLPPQPANGNGNHGGPKVRDRLCQLFASISSIPTWSRPMPPISAASRLFAMPPASKWKTSSRIWPTGPRKTATPCSASSTAILGQKEGAA